MNDHVAKPVDHAQFYATLLRWLPLPAPPADRPAGNGAQAADAAPAVAPLQERLAAIDGLDVEVMMRSLAGHLPLLERVFKRFVETDLPGLPALLDERGSEAEWGRPPPSSVPAIDLTLESHAHSASLYPPDFAAPPTRDRKPA